jgi:hypothetical protein
MARLFGPSQMVGFLAHAKWLAMKISMLSPNFSNLQLEAARRHVRIEISLRARNAGGGKRRPGGIS